jgi:hypothetical protein
LKRYARPNRIIKNGDSIKMNGVIGIPNCIATPQNKNNNTANDKPLFGHTSDLLF